MLVGSALVTYEASDTFIFFRSDVVAVPVTKRRFIGFRSLYVQTNGT